MTTLPAWGHAAGLLALTPERLLRPAPSFALLPLTGAQLKNVLTPYPSCA